LPPDGAGYKYRLEKTEVNIRRNRKTDVGRKKGAHASGLLPRTMDIRRRMSEVTSKK